MNKFIRTIRISNFLSFNAKSQLIRLKPLNLIIGPNGSGKSNLLEAVDILRSTAGDLTAAIRKGGGVGEWLWKGEIGECIAKLDITVSCHDRGMPLRYILEFTQVGQKFELVDEVVEDEEKRDQAAEQPYFYYHYNQGNPILNVRQNPEAEPESSQGRSERRLRREDLSLDQSVLAQRRDPDQYVFSQTVYRPGCFRIFTGRFKCFRSDHFPLRFSTGLQKTIAGFHDRS